MRSTCDGNSKLVSHNMKIVAVLYPGGEIAKEEPRMLGRSLSAIAGGRIKCTDGVCIGCVENELGLREWLESQGHTYIVTDDKEAPCELDKHLPDTDILITTPFHPAYIGKERFDVAKKLKLAVTAGVGSDHISLAEARKHNVSVVEVTGSNVVSVAEHVMTSILVLIKNFLPAHEQIVKGNWNVAEAGGYH